MKYKPKSKVKLLSEARANKLRNKLIEDGKLSPEFGDTTLNEIQLELLVKGNLDGKKVTIDVDAYEVRFQNNEMRNEKFREFIRNSKNKVFTAKLIEGSNLIKYELEEVEYWIFTIFDLNKTT